MSAQEIKENKNVSILITHKEYNVIQELALKHKETLLHYYEKGGVKVTIALSFIIEFGFLDLIEF